MSTQAATAIRAPQAADSVAETIEAYIATWNETDPARRRAGIARAWAAEARYRDPVMSSDGHAGVDAMIAGVQAKFPGLVLKRTSKVDSHNGPNGGYVRFSWSLGPAAGPTVIEGVDFCALAPDGRLASVVGFIDKAP